MSRVRSSAACALVLASSLGAIASAEAERLHLRSGGAIDVLEWWVDGDVLTYRTADGTVGLPRELVARIGPASAGSADPPTSRPADHARSDDPSPALRVSRELAQRLRAANAALRARDFSGAASAYQTVMLETDADFHPARVGYALSQMALGEDDLALSVVLEALAWSPEQPELLELLGDLRNREERVADALRSWRAAFRIEPNDRIREKILTAERELQAGRHYDLTASSHFNLRFDGEIDAPLADEVIEHLERQFWRLAELLDHTPRQPINVILYPTREFRDVTRAPDWVGGTYDGKIRVPMGGLERLDPSARAVLTHELTHAFVHSKTRGHCPRWLHEGLAQQMEGRSVRRADRATIVARIRRTGPSAWESEGFSYPVALSLVLHLVDQRGFHRIVDLLERLGQGESLERAMVDVYGHGYDELCRDWAEHLLAENRR